MLGKDRWYEERSLILRRIPPACQDARVQTDIVRTGNLDEAIAAVGRVYCPHRVMPQGPVRSVDAELAVTRVGGQPIVYLRYSTPVTIDAGHFPDLLLMMSASSGAANAVQSRRACAWRAGQTMPLSPGRDTVLNFDRAFAQTSLRVEIGRLERMCARWLGHPLERSIQFQLQPFDPSFEKIWQDAMRMVSTLGAAGTLIPRGASDSLDEFLLSLILHGHPHNFSTELSRPFDAAAPRLVLAAEEMFRERAASGTTVTEVARDLGVSVRSLQLGFRQSRETTPSAFLRTLRLEAAHRALSAGANTQSVTDVALGIGFTHIGRFSAAYKAAFGETPVMTLRRSRQHG
jgi:AraC-like DNA-binding protein